MKIFVYSTLETSQQTELCKRLPAESEIYFRPELSDNEALACFSTAEIILGNPPTEWFKEPPSNLLFWQLDSAGFDQYQHIETTATVANMGDFFSDECSETIIGGILAFYRGIDRLIKLQIQKKWDGKRVRPTLRLLGNKNVLILGAGGIGTAVKRILDGFGCRVKTTARTNPKADFHSYSDVLKALPTFDLVINTLPGTAEQYVSEEFINAMSSDSVYANVGRGNTTDEKALIKALQSGKLAGAILDVTENEPLFEDSPLWSMKNVILTQHTGGGNDHENEGKIGQFISNFNKFLNNEIIEDQVDITSGY